MSRSGNLQLSHLYGSCAEQVYQFDFIGFTFDHKSDCNPLSRLSKTDTWEPLSHKCVIPVLVSANLNDLTGN